MTDEAYRSAVTGEYVTEDYARQHPDTTIKETTVEADPTATDPEPDEETLPPKPPITDEPPTADDSFEEEPVPDEEFGDDEENEADMREDAEEQPQRALVVEEAGEEQP